MKWWSGQPRSWGPNDARWRVWFGLKVIDGLCEVLDEHIAAQHEGYPAAIGCVPWFGSKAVAERLLQLTSCCIVVDKEHLGIVPDRLLEADLGMASIALSLGSYRPSDQDEVALGESFNQGYEYELGPVRVYGWRKQRNVFKPLLHTKLLILGETRVETYYPGDAPSFEELNFVPQTAWFGSANWTESSKLYQEIGFICDDPELVMEATSYVRTLIAESEPVTSAHHIQPTPNLEFIDYEPSPEEVAELLADFDEQAELDEWLGGQSDEDEDR
jgi:hypothetical protein